MDKSQRTEFMSRALKALQHRHLDRHINAIQAGCYPWLEVDGRRLLNLSSNNYLGLASRLELNKAAISAIETWGNSAGSSRLVSGTSNLQQSLETRLAQFKEAESALLFSSGYMANLGIIQALVGPSDLVLGDELNHASLIDGCRLSGATYQTYAHCDLSALKNQLSDSTKYRRRLVVTDTVFSMDGDVAPLAEIADLCNQYDALLMVDEAHATGCIGPGGRGLVAQLKLENEVLVSVSTLSKALGGFGAFMTGSALVKEYLINTARTFIFTTALPPAVVASALAALELLEHNPEMVERLQENATFLRSGLQAAGFNTLVSTTQIIPVVIGESNKALEMATQLRDEGVFAVAIRPPTVPVGAARIRVSVMATHSKSHLAAAIGVFSRVGKRLGLIT